MGRCHIQMQNFRTEIFFETLKRLVSSPNMIKFYVVTIMNRFHPIYTDHHTFMWLLTFTQNTSDWLKV